MCHLSFCQRCTCTGIFCHQCLQVTFLTRDPPLTDPVKTAEMIAPESIVHLVGQIQVLKEQLEKSQKLVRELQDELAEKSKVEAQSMFHFNAFSADSAQRSQTHTQVSDLSGALTPPLSPRSLAPSMAQNGALRPPQSSLAPLSASALAMHGAEKSPTSIFLREQNLSAFDAQLIGQYLKTNAQISFVDLSDNTQISDIGATAVSSALRGNGMGVGLNRLVMYNTGIRDDGAVSLAEALCQSTTLLVLELSENAIGNPGASGLADALKVNRSVTDLGLSVNLIGDEGATALAACLQLNNAIRTLTLDYNAIRDNGALCLAASIGKNSSLTAVDLSNNNISEQGRLRLAALAAQRPALKLTF